jgi:hypothetical protein
MGRAFGFFGQRLAAAAACLSIFQNMYVCMYVCVRMYMHTRTPAQDEEDAKAKAEQEAAAAAEEEPEVEGRYEVDGVVYLDCKVR